MHRMVGAKLLSVVWMFLLTFLMVHESQGGSGRPPNVVLILADDLGYGELGCYGQEKIETPHIDRLAAEGIKFSQFYSGSPVCAPARCILLTGKHAGHAYIRGNDEWRERGEVWDFKKAVENPNLEGQRPLPAGTLTIGKIFQQAGYRTACVGKWGLGGPLSEGAPNLQGFDYFFGYNCQRQAHTYTPVHLWENDQKLILDNELVIPGTKLDPGCDPKNPACYNKYQQNDYSPARLLRSSLEFIEKNKDNPFFLYYATPIPHAPLQAPEEKVAYYRNKFGTEEPYLGIKGYFPNMTPRATYAAMVSHLDDQVGELVNLLKDLDLYENTVIMFTSDNGPTYNGGTDSEFFNSAGPFREEYGRGKGFLYEGGIRVPLIVSWPGHIPPDGHTDHLGAFYDLLPTLMDIAGIEPGIETDGISFYNELIGKDDQVVHEYLYFEFPEYGGQQAVRIGNFKGIRKNMHEGNTNIELYELTSDLLEELDIARQNPDMIAKIEEIFEAEHESSILERFRIDVIDKSP